MALNQVLKKRVRVDLRKAHRALEPGAALNHSLTNPELGLLGFSLELRETISARHHCCVVQVIAAT